MSTLTTSSLDVAKDQRRSFSADSIGIEGVDAAAVAQPQTTPSSESIDFPDFRDYSATVSAHAMRAASRLVASKVTDEEFQRLLQERQELVAKKLNGSINRKESTRLDYVRWSLERIEDARHGVVLDRLEDRINRYEDFLEKLDSFKESLDRVRRQRR